MKLDHFLAEKKLSPVAFAKQIDVNPSTLWRIRTGKVRPDWKTIDAIADATKGLVSADDFMPSPGQHKGAAA